jgi:MinD-like ATPase involved in chromosome partitioning or flagellar assembly
MPEVRRVRRGLRSATDALRVVATGSTVVARELTAADERLRAPIATSRRIAVLQADGGAGVTTVVARCGAVLHRRRGGGVLVVDAARGRACLAARSGVRVPLSLAQAQGRVSGVVRAAQVSTLFPRSAAGLAVLGAGTDEAEPGPASPELWHSAVDPVGWCFDVVVTDWGVRTCDEDLAQIAQAHHVVAVTARADRGCAERGLALAARLAALVPGTRVALVLVDLGGTGGSTAALVERQLRTTRPAPWVGAVPHEPRLGAGVYLDDAAPLTLAGRCAFARVADGLLSLSRDPAIPARLGAARLVQDGA